MVRIYGIDYEVSTSQDDNAIDSGSISVSTSGDALDAIDVLKEHVSYELQGSLSQEGPDQLEFFISSIELLAEADLEGE